MADEGGMFWLDALRGLGGDAAFERLREKLRRVARRRAGRVPDADIDELVDETIARLYFESADLEDDLHLIARAANILRNLWRARLRRLRHESVRATLDRLPRRIPPIDALEWADLLDWLASRLGTQESRLLRLVFETEETPARLRRSLGLRREAAKKRRQRMGARVRGLLVGLGS